MLTWMRPAYFDIIIMFYKTMIPDTGVLVPPMVPPSTTGAQGMLSTPSAALLPPEGSAWTPRLEPSGQEMMARWGRWGGGEPTPDIYGHIK